MDDKNFSVDMLKYELELIIPQGYWNSRFIQRIPLKKIKQYLSEQKGNTLTGSTVGLLHICWSQPLWI